MLQIFMSVQDPPFALQNAWAQQRLIRKKRIERNCRQEADCTGHPSTFGIFFGVALVALPLVDFRRGSHVSCNRMLYLPGLPPKKLCAHRRFLGGPA